MKPRFEALKSSSFLYGENAPYIEALYEHYLQDPSQLSADWCQFFEDSPPIDSPAPALTLALAPLTPSPPPNEPPDSTAPRRDALECPSKQGAVLRLINAYRVRGHQNADLDPLGLYPRPVIEDLNPAFHHLLDSDMATLFSTGSLVAPDSLTLAEIMAMLQRCYCGNIGSEYMHITETQQKRWIQQRVERPYPKLTPSERNRILERIVATEGLERYLHNRYVGQKRFSLEGGESLIPLLDELVQRAGQHGVEEIIIGMAHRGRLNVLINILGKSPQELFDEFEGKPHLHGSGDVKYHLGHSTNINTALQPVHLVLAFNPSHLEIVSPVVQGSVRARQQRYNDMIGMKVMPVVLHGDSAFAGQGVVMETLQMSQARGYATGGTIHIVINNQIGFTTSNRLDTRSTLYCTDVAKMVQAPIFHVNGDDPEAVLFVTRLAFDYRHTFHKDVVIDMVCYRRHGHNEADEPSTTQPMMYRKVNQHPTLVQLYSEHLIQHSEINSGTIDAMLESYHLRLEAGEVVARDVGPPHIDSEFLVNWHPYRSQKWDQRIETKVSLPHLRLLSDRLQQLPVGFELHPRVAKVMDDRRKMAAGALPFNWGAAELLAYASLLMEGFEVRLSGQDAGRGTFSHRHAVLHNQNRIEAYVPLQNIAPEQPHFIVIDSLLSEEAVLGFEYGYATAEPHALVIWEAQFGDFANGAQVVIDQFITAGEAKWGRLCGLTMFLPHGFEGQGAEHSSARLERYLQLCAEHNIQVCIPTTPAQLFHMLRRQMVRPYRKPLVVMMPKSLLRHKLSVSSLEDLYQGRFNTVLDDLDSHPPHQVKRLLLCSGKLYFDLLEHRRELQCETVAILRIEQLYPFPAKALTRLLRRYPNAFELFWCQEEPKNQGAWYASQHHLKSVLQAEQELSYVGRPLSAAPAVGSYKLHSAQQQKLIQQAFAGLDCELPIQGIEP